MLASKITYALAGVGLYVGGTEFTEYVSPPMIEGFGEYTEAVSAGDLVPVKWTITKRTDCPGLTSRAWYGEGGFQLTEPVQTTNLPIVDRGEYVIQTKVPELAPDGKLDLRIIGHFDCGRGPVAFELGPVPLIVVTRKG